MKTLNIICVVFLLFSGNICRVHAQSWLWAQEGVGDNSNVGRAIATDVNGNVYAAGTFNCDSIQFGPYWLLDSLFNVNNVFVVKYNSSGAIRWARRAGSTFVSDALGVAIDTAGNAIVAGNFGGGSITFGSFTLNNSGGVGGTNMYLTKYDTSGNIIWAVRAGGTDSTILQAVTTDAEGNIYVTGYFRCPTIVFGADTLHNTSILSNNFDLFIAKYDNLGHALWGRMAGGSLDDKARSIRLDTAGNIYICGQFTSSSLTFGSTTLTNSHPGVNDIFVVKYDKTGNVLWAKGSTGTNNDNATSLATDIAGNVYVTGSFISPIFSLGSTFLTNTGYFEDIFLLKYNSSGMLQWARSAGDSITIDQGWSVVTDKTGNVYMAGYYGNKPIYFGSITLTPAGGYNSFIVKYNSSGTALWAVDGRGPNWNWGFAIALDTASNIYMTGSFEGPFVAFGTDTLVAPGPLGGFGLFDAFVAKLSQSTTLYTASNNTLKQNHIVIYPNPNNGSMTVVLTESCTELTIHDYLGKTIFYRKIAPGNNLFTIELPNLPNGVYYLTANGEKGIESSSFIINH